MILLDTHILVWWVNQELKLSATQKASIENASAVAISAISLWEIAKLVEHQKLSLNLPVLDWINVALTHPKIQVIPLHPEIIVASTQLPGTFHKDPADQIIVATAMYLNVPLLTKDAKILAYSHVNSIG
ncbi:MAG: type II toxin-antitoxin system VapC family toxin [Saprospiraceae bacterium]